MHTNSENKVFHAIMRHHVPATPACQKRSGSTNAARSGTVRHHQVHSGTLRYPLKRSTSILVQPSTSVSSTTTVAIATTASRATDTLHCFNGLQQPQRPSRPQAPKEPQRPQGWMLSFDSHPPIPQLFVNNLFLCTAHKIPMSESVETVALVAIVAFVLGIHCDHAHLAHQTHHHDDAHNRYKSPTITLYYEIRCKITFFRNIQPAYY